MNPFHDRTIVPAAIRLGYRSVCVRRSHNASKPSSKFAIA